MTPDGCTESPRWEEKVFSPKFGGSSQSGRKPGGLLSMGSHRVGHDWCDLAAAAAAVSQSVIRRRQWLLTPVLLPGKSHWRRSLVGCSPWGRKESDTTERLHFHFSLSCTGEGNGNPFQCSCLENPRDGGAWWAAVYGVAQSRTRLKRLSSSSSQSFQFKAKPLSNWPPLALIFFSN